MKKILQSRAVYHKGKKGKVRFRADHKGLEAK